MGLDADLYISKTYRVPVGGEKKDVTFCDTSFAKVALADFWTSEIVCPLEDNPLDYRYKRTESLCILHLGKAWGIYPFLEKLLGYLPDQGKIHVPEDLVLSMLYQLHSDCLNRKLPPPGGLDDVPWLDIHGRMQTIQKFIEVIIDTGGRERKFKSGWEDFDWFWELSY